MKKINITGQILTNEDMKNHTTFKTGGKADFFIIPQSIDDLITIKKHSLKYSIPLFILGEGANLLVSDKGIEGMTVDMTHVKGHEREESCLITEAGMSVNEACEIARNMCLSGLEFIYGMPGTVGGALWMNARCYGSEIADILAWAEYIDEEGNIQRLKMDPDQWAYKISPFQKRDLIITKACFRLKDGDKEQISTLMDKNHKDRFGKGHFNYPCAGSVFKNNREFGAPSGKIIDDAGLRGTARGDALISDYHANIIINKGEARSEDIKALIDLVQSEVKKKFGYDLEPEVLLVGRWEDTDA